MINYAKRSAISQEHRTYIRENLGNIRDYTLNQINDYLSSEEEHMNSLKHLENFRVDVYKGSKKIKTKTFKRIQDAEVMCDRICEYGEGAPKGISIGFFQCDKLIKAYIKGIWKYPKTSMYDSEITI